MTVERHAPNMPQHQRLSLRAQLYVGRAGMNAVSPQRLPGSISVVVVEDVGERGEDLEEVAFCCSLDESAYILGDEHLRL